MTTEETAEKADDMYSSKKGYVLAAKKVLPILVRQARSHNPIYYSDLAQEIGMENPQNLNYPLGAIGNTLKITSQKLGIPIPQIQAIVLSKSTDLPGDGYFPFVDVPNHKKLTGREKKEITDVALREIYHFKHWSEVINDIGLVELKVPRMPLTVYGIEGRSGESEQHKKLKEFVSRHPELFGGTSKDKAIIEYGFPSGDAIDVWFQGPKMNIGVEVKSGISSEDDILRGIFQCIKYKALAEAMNVVENVNLEVKIYLGLESKFPSNLLPFKNSLKVDVIDNLKLKKEAIETKW